MRYLAKLQCHFHGRHISGEVEAVGGRNAVIFRSEPPKRERVACGLMGSWWDHGRIGRRCKLYFMSFLLQIVVVAFRFASCYPHTVLDVHVLLLSNMNLVATVVFHPIGCSAHRTGRFMCYDFCVKHEFRNSVCSSTG